MGYESDLAAKTVAARDAADSVDDNSNLMLGMGVAMPPAFMAALAERGRPVDGAAVLVLGLAYKPDVDDTRESPSFVIIEELLAAGARVDYHDPWVPATRPVRHASCPPMTSVPKSAVARTGVPRVGCAR